MSSDSAARLLGGQAVSREASSAFKRDNYNLDPALSASKPALSLSFESSPTLSIGNGSPHVPWQQPYSELSRFPSASYRFRPGRDNKEWPPEGSQYMTPLPSPSAQSRSRSTSDAASETSFVSETPSTSSKPGTSKSKTLQFFQSADSAMSPPPPPRMPSADYDHRKKEDWTPSTTGSSSFARFNTNSPPRSSTSVRSQRFFDEPASKTSASFSPVNIDSSSSLPPLSNLTSNFRSEPSQSRSNATASTSNPSTHRRLPSGGSLAFTPSALGKSSSVIDSPLASPTDLPNSRWVKELPSRLPTLLTEQQHTPLSTEIASPSSAREARPPLSSLSLQDTHSSKDSASSRQQQVSPTTPAQECEPGMVLKGRYEIVRQLGIGSFSKVVLAKCLALGTSDSDDAASTRRNHHRMPSGPYPTSLARGHARSRSRQNLGTEEPDLTNSDSLVAIKLISRSHIKKNDRMRISIVREVEVLKVSRVPCSVCCGFLMTHSPISTYGIHRLCTLLHPSKRLGIHA